MDKRYITIMGDGIEETYSISLEISSTTLKEIYKEWLELEDCEDSFDVWMSDAYPTFEIERIFTETIHI